MMSTSLKHTPLAALSRPVAGTIKDTLVLTLPGSVKAVKENLEALVSGGVIHHAIDLINGGTGKRVHAVLALEGSSNMSVSSQGHPSDYHHHHHHYDHHAPQPKTALSRDPSLPGRCEDCDIGAEFTIKYNSFCTPPSFAL
jgi:gephyrin